MTSSKKIGILGVPQDFGASRRGVDMGPSAIRVAGLRTRLEELGHEVKDYGNVPGRDREKFRESVKNLRLRHIAPIIEMCENVKKAVAEIRIDGFLPLVLGGDHSISIGSIGGIRGTTPTPRGILWIDAHGSFNTPETTPSGNIHGMSFAILTGRGDERLTKITSGAIAEEKSVLLAVRDIDPGEDDNLKNSKIHVFTMRTIDEEGIYSVTKKALEIVTKDHDQFYLTFDLGALDPVEAPGTGTRVEGGLTYREALLLMEMVHETGKLGLLEFVEVNPTLDVRNKTAEIAVGLITTALGKKIL